MIRTSKAQWNGSLKDGKGTVSLGSGAYDGQYSFSSRFESGTGTNPEQLFAAGWSACFESAMEFAARNMKITLPADHAVDAEIDLGPEGGGFTVAARLYVSLPGMERAAAQRLVQAAHQVCSYSRATYGNIAVETTLV